MLYLSIVTEKIPPINCANNKNEHMLVDFRVPSVATYIHQAHLIIIMYLGNVKDTGIAIATPTRTQPSESAALGEARGQTYG